MTRLYVSISPLADMAYRLDVDRPLVRVRDAGRAELEQLLRRVAEHLAEVLVDLDETPRGGGERHADGRALERPAEPRLALLERTLRVDAVGDVLERDGESVAVQREDPAAQDAVRDPVVAVLDLAAVGRNAVGERP